MNQSLICFLLLCLSPWFASAQEGAVPVPQKIQDSLKKYVDFAAEWTSHQYSGQDLPKVKIQRHELVQVFAYGDYEYAQAESKGIKLATVNAVYLPENKTIYVSDKVDLNDPQLEVTIVHEMVHYLQDISGYTDSLRPYLVCTESEAYDVQYLWQKMNNIDVANLHLVYQESLKAAMRCMGNQSSAFGRSSRFNPN